MAKPKGHLPGTFCWFELSTTDPGAAVAFYTGLFGWKTRHEEMPGGGTYTMLRAGGGDVAGLYELTPQLIGEGVPPHWLSYVATEDVDAAARRAAKLGGTVVGEPADVPNVARVAGIQDPTGALFALYQPAGFPGAAEVGEIAGRVSWMELQTSDPEAAGRFYGGLFDWKQETTRSQGVDYTVFSMGATNVAGMMQIQPGWGEVPSNWSPYFEVDDCERAASEAKRLGGTVIVEPKRIPGAGTFAVIEDPQGAVFSVLESAR